MRMCLSCTMIRAVTVLQHLHSKSILMSNLASVWINLMQCPQSSPNQNNGPGHFLKTTSVCLKSSLVKAGQSTWAISLTGWQNKPAINLLWLYCWNYSTDHCCCRISDWRWTFQTDGRTVIDLHHSQVCPTKNPTITPPAWNNSPFLERIFTAEIRSESPVGISVSWWEVVFLNQFPGELSCLMKAGQFFITTVWEELEFWANQRQLSRQPQLGAVLRLTGFKLEFQRWSLVPYQQAQLSACVRCSERQSCSGLDDWLQTRGQLKCWYTMGDKLLSSENNSKKVHWCVNQI